LLLSRLFTYLKLSKMKHFILFLLSISILLIGCKKNKNDNQATTDEDVQKVYAVTKIVTDAKLKFLELAPQTGGDPKIALMKTMDWVDKQPGVVNTSQYDSTYLLIEMSSGIAGVFWFMEIAPDGSSRFRGNGIGSLKAINSSGNCSNVIENKNVLIYAPGYDEFHYDSISRVPNLLNGSSKIENVDFAKNEQATAEKINDFSNYGLVLMETHGMPWSFMTGTSFTINNTEFYSDYDEFRDTLVEQLGQSNFNRLIAGKLMVGSKGEYNPLDPEWWTSDRKYVSYSKYVLWASSKFLADIPSLSNTIVFGNFCCSGWVEPVTGQPIGKAFMDKNPITYYAYQRDDGYSRPVDNLESMALEDSVVRSLVVDGDSTGNAHLKYDGSLFVTTFPDLFLKQFGHPDWCYGGCGDPFTDTRDGQVYRTVCIGNQRWMAENLNYSAGGTLGVCYDSLQANCDEYGRLYRRAEITGGTTSSSNPSGVQGICPNGWHVPSRSEWDELFNVCCDQGILTAGFRLLAEDGWNDGPSGGTDVYGFGVKPAGYQEVIPGLSNDFKFKGDMAYYWLTDPPANGSEYAALHFNFTTVVYDEDSPDDGGQYRRYSCRCVKDK